MSNLHHSSLRALTSYDLPGWFAQRLQYNGDLKTPYYYPQFLWKFFLNPIGPKWLTPYRVHIYDTFNDALVEMRRVPQSTGIFAHLARGNLDEEGLTLLKETEDSFTLLQSTVERALATLLRKLATTPVKKSLRGDVQLDRQTEFTLRKYFIFLRYRNSEQYLRTIECDWTGTCTVGEVREGPNAVRWKSRMKVVLRQVRTFLDYEGQEDITVLEPCKDIEENCWKPMMEAHTELTIGVACEDQEFIVTDKGYGNLDDIDPDGSCDHSYHLFFPLTPTVALYLVTRPPSLLYGKLRDVVTVEPWFRPTADDDPFLHEPALRKVPALDFQTKREGLSAFANSSGSTSKKRSRDADGDEVMVKEAPPLKKEFQERERESSGSDTKADESHIYSLPYEAESVSDVHLRNAILLRSSPRYVLFSSLASLITSITALTSTNANFSSFPSTSFDGLPLNTSLSRLRTKCREKHIKEGLVKTLVLKDHVTVSDLTDDVKVIGGYPEFHGSFADIWKGEWTEKGPLGLGTAERVVALKVLRQHMKSNVKEKLLKRLKYEVLTWYRLKHPHIIQFYGIVRWPHTLAMASPWCKNGTVIQYLKEVNPDADRLALMIQIASGVAYLHNFEPVVIHGDLKGNNILVDSAGRALIADFGISSVIEDSLSDSGSASLAESLLGGATRWIAPEIMQTLVEDNGRLPELTKASDVYAFATVCLEIVTGKLPYPHRTNACVVMIDKLAGVKPCFRVSRVLQNCASIQRAEGDVGPLLGKLRAETKYVRD